MEDYKYDNTILFLTNKTLQGCTRLTYKEKKRLETTPKNFRLKKTKVNDKEIITLTFNKLSEGKQRFVDVPRKSELEDTLFKKAHIVDGKHLTKTLTTQNLKKYYWFSKSKDISQLYSECSECGGETESDDEKSDASTDEISGSDNESDTSESTSTSKKRVLKKKKTTSTKKKGNIIGKKRSRATKDIESDSTESDDEASDFVPLRVDGPLTKEQVHTKIREIKKLKVDIRRQLEMCKKKWSNVIGPLAQKINILNEELGYLNENMIGDFSDYVDGEDEDDEDDDDEQDKMEVEKKATPSKAKTPTKEKAPAKDKTPSKPKANGTLFDSGLVEKKTPATDSTPAATAATTPATTTTTTTPVAVVQEPKAMEVSPPTSFAAPAKKAAAKPVAKPVGKVAAPAKKAAAAVAPAQESQVVAKKAAEETPKPTTVIAPKKASAKKPAAKQAAVKKPIEPESEEEDSSDEDSSDENDSDENDSDDTEADSDEFEETDDTEEDIQETPKKRSVSDTPSKKKSNGVAPPASQKKNSIC